MLRTDTSPVEAATASALRCSASARLSTGASAACLRALFSDSVRKSGPFDYSASIRAFSCPAALIAGSPKIVAPIPNCKASAPNPAIPAVVACLL